MLDVTSYVSCEKGRNKKAFVRESLLVISVVNVEVRLIFQILSLCMLYFSGWLLKMIFICMKGYGSPGSFDKLLEMC